MQFNDTPAVRLTEKIMAAVQKKMNLPVHQYNPIYTAVLSALENEALPDDSGLDAQSKAILSKALSGKSDVIQFQGGGGMFINRKPK